MTDIPPIETPRFRLRAARRDDFDEYARMWADERTTRFIGGAPRDRTTSWGKFLAMPGLWALMGYGYWIFAERDSDRPMGGGGFSNFERGIAGLEGFAEAGWAIEPDWWGKGAVSEIMAAALIWAALFLAVVIGPYRRGDTGAWWGILVSVVVLGAVAGARVLLTGASAGAGEPVVLLVVVLVALLLDVRRLSGPR